jgi:two-component system sensor histidine kinase CpxA
VNSLFAKTFLWFMATVILTFVAMIVAAAIDIEPEQRQRSPFGAMLMLQFVEARYAFEQGGPGALAAALERFRQATGVQGILTDGKGNDLLTGENRLELVKEIRSRPRWPFFYRNRTVIGRRSTDGQYIYFMQYERRNWLRWFLRPEVHLAMLLVLGVFSWAFARRLTNPVQQLQRAVDCLGRGDFHTRVRSNRRDEIGQLARTFDRMAERIETLLAAERRLLLDISHELRSPLARLSVALELARTDAGNEKHFDRIQKEIERLNALVGELLQVTRAEGDEAKKRFETVDLGAVVENVVGDVQVEATARGNRVVVTERQPISLQADPELLRRAVENVVRNAIRFAPANTPVEVSVWNSGNFATVCVRDHGPGVPEEAIARIFDAFYRVESHRDRASGGVGLGLAIARRAIELHDGQVRARNAHPGLEVEIRLPV